jgi:glycogen operon protein
MTHAVHAGSPHPLGARADGDGVNFALYSASATRVELCLFDDNGVETRLPATGPSGHVWHLRVSGVGPGQRYGWRVDGPYAPERGDRHNPYKLLVDPYARAIEGGWDWRGPIYGFRHVPGGSRPPVGVLPAAASFEDSVPCDRDDAAAKPRCVVVDDAFDWGDDRPPAVPWSETVVYELHVKGFTHRHPGVPEPHRGRFLGVASDAAIEHLVSLGVTAVELMPVHAHLDEPALSARGLTNYWGYSTVGYFAPDERFAVPRASGGEGAGREFKRMVKRLHAAGIEVILDVVYNHTCEGDRAGPTVLFRGIDDRTYYRHKPGSPGAYEDITGCGNTIDTSHPQVIKLIADSLRYWATEMHVDGFRLDLATVLGRNEKGTFDSRSALFAVVLQDPLLSRLKLMAEPWDLGEDGYQLGAFPAPWAEWNGRFRDAVRRFWRGEPGIVADLGYRLTGSSDVFAGSQRTTHASINFVTAHDGFTLRDLVSYEHKHNLANGERNEDGTNDNASQNCGVEGESDDAGVLARRRTVARSILGTMLVSRGVPMLAMGDELWRTQRGSNNAYCQDSELTWVDWAAASVDPDARAMLEFVRSAVARRKQHSELRSGDFLQGRATAGSAHNDITWLRADGTEMTGPDWASPGAARLAFHLAGAAGSPVAAAILVLMNGDAKPGTFVLPGPSYGASWRVTLDARTKPQIDATLPAAASIELDAGALVVFAAS